MAVKLDESFWSKVNKDAPNGCWEWTGSKLAAGYGQWWHDGKRDLAHRASLTAHTGETGDGLHADHTCFNKSCVNPNHLRYLTREQNMQNQPGPYRNSKSGVRGVSWCKASGKWVARGSVNKKQRVLGKFDSLEEAGSFMREWRKDNYPSSVLDRAA